MTLGYRPTTGYLGHSAFDYKSHPIAPAGSKVVSWDARQAWILGRPWNGRNIRWPCNAPLQSVQSVDSTDFGSSRRKPQMTICCNYRVTAFRTHLFANAEAHSQIAPASWVDSFLSRSWASAVSHGLGLSSKTKCLPARKRTSRTQINVSH
jgi:hypothetical protein